VITLNSILAGLLIGFLDAVGFFVTLRIFGSAGAKNKKQALAVTFEIVRLAVLCTVLILLCVKAHFAVPWLLGAAISVSFLGKVILAIKKPVSPL
jgi:hypothetical protein